LVSYWDWPRQLHSVVKCTSSCQWYTCYCSGVPLTWRRTFHCYCSGENGDFGKLPQPVWRRSSDGGSDAAVQRTNWAGISRTSVCCVNIIYCFCHLWHKSEFLLTCFTDCFVVIVSSCVTPFSVLMTERRCGPVKSPNTIQYDIRLLRLDRTQAIQHIQWEITSAVELTR